MKTEDKIRKMKAARQRLSTMIETAEQELLQQRAIEKQQGISWEVIARFEAGDYIVTSNMTRPRWCRNGKPAERAKPEEVSALHRLVREGIIEQETMKV